MIKGILVELLFAGLGTVMAALLAANIAKMVSGLFHKRDVVERVLAPFQRAIALLCLGSGSTRNNHLR